MDKIRVVVAGACGRMGQEVIRTVLQAEDLELVGAVDIADHAGKPVAEGVVVKADLEATLKEVKPDVMVDFTWPGVVLANIRTALAQGVAPVVGTTGLSEADLNTVRSQSEACGVPVFIAPNFSLGAVLMMQFARQAAPHFDFAEIIELHHAQKRDAPSGTASLTAQRMLEARGRAFRPLPVEEEIKLDGVRGGQRDNLRIHSVRLPGLVAHQEVIFGGRGETLTLRHDAPTREAYMDGVLLAIRKVRSLSGLVVGLEALLA